MEYKHTVRMVWEKVPVEGQPGKWYVIEKIGDAPNRLRFGPMESDMVGPLIEERQIIQKQAIEEFLESIGATDARIQTELDGGTMDQ